MKEEPKNFSLRDIDPEEIDFFEHTLEDFDMLVEDYGDIVFDNLRQKTRDQFAVYASSQLERKQ